jgi:hypothetical protein
VIVPPLWAPAYGEIDETAGRVSDEPFSST